VLVFEGRNESGGEKALLGPRVEELQKPICHKRGPLRGKWHCDLQS